MSVSVGNSAMEVDVAGRIWDLKAMLIVLSVAICEYAVEWLQGEPLCPGRGYLPCHSDTYFCRQAFYEIGGRGWSGTICPASVMSVTKDECAVESWGEASTCSVSMKSVTISDCAVGGSMWYG